MFKKSNIKKDSERSNLDRVPLSLMVLLATISVLSSGYIFADNLPEWKNIHDYKLNKYQFQKTKYEDFSKAYSGAKTYTIDKNTKILSIKLDNNDIYSGINVGFTKNVMDWLEFTFSTNMEIRDLITIYGQPQSIDSKQNKTYDYYNYDTFNIAVDKRHIFAKSISFFDVKQGSVAQNLRSKIDPVPAKKFFELFPNLKPGVSIESQFTQNYPDQLPYMEGEFEVVATYTLTDELQEAIRFYDKVELRFENGLLSWINLFPNETEAKNLYKKISTPYKVEKLDKKLEFYVFDKYIYTIDKTHKKVISIGLFDSVSGF